VAVLVGQGMLDRLATLATLEQGRLLVTRATRELLETKELPETRVMLALAVMSVLIQPLVVL
jgi:hypothetical protein